MGSSVEVLPGKKRFLSKYGHFDVKYVLKGLGLFLIDIIFVRCFALVNKILYRMSGSLYLE